MAHQPSPQPEPEQDPNALNGGPAGAPQPLPQPPVTSGDLIGQTLEGRYRFETLLGEGSFARVFKVYDLNRRVHLAAKVLRSDIAHEPMFLERFRREAAVLQRLQHPHIVRYYDIVESGDLVFILTDYIPGRTLQSVLRQHGGPLTPAESLVYLQPLTAALHFAHQEGVVHRDLKPANILLDQNNHLYITDFGIARILSDASTLTMDSTVGTPHYMSPEQILIGEVTVATDIYALGVMLYQMYTGQLPFIGESQGTSGSTAAMRIVYEHLHLKPPSPSEVNPALSPAVAAVVMRCLEKDPAQRYQSVTEVYDALVTAVGAPAPGTIPVPGRSVSASEAERVPTGVGGMSRVVPEDDYLPGEEEAQEPGWDRRKRKRGTRWERRRARLEDRLDRIESRYAEREQYAADKAKRGTRSQRELAEMSEKEREKEQDSEEKNNEKQNEKGWDTDIEKGEFFSDIGPSDRLSQFTWGGAVLWAGIVFMLGLGNPWAWILGGGGTLLLAEVGVRLAVPEYRAKPGARLVFGTVLLSVGLGIGIGFSNLWPLILIAIGASLLLNRLIE